ncbi:MAG: DegT/DnrJ/EryC1/StrS family aminotransferase [Pseudosphingobacterium sp.]|nr:DegT/DnrJ/EryC1/StrS family aminotransferase [Olivibacter sp. UJ_SKK_5.1]MDX3912863.1 DegT/DnrJ/EryC1/StrS family aminotransferase [Pseudosphingobacterium sp.]
MIQVTKPFMPPMEEYLAYIKDIWSRQWLTNNGPLVNHLELRLKELLDVKHMILVNNGTIALQIAIKALNLRGDVITTPFSFVATTSALVWEGCRPVFVDIDPNTLNIDPNKIEEAITSETSAILATHVYGNPCEIEKIQAIAEKHNLKVIYDAAHCFGTLYKGKSIFSYGDVSTLSLHATKVFHTIEGGAVFTSTPELLKKIAYMRNFGFSNVDEISELGINGKNSEFHAAMGLANLPYIESISLYRKELYDYYEERLQSFNGKKIKVNVDGIFNYAYYPIIFNSEEDLVKSLHELNNNRIYPRRYFYPSLHTLPYVNATSVPVSQEMAKRVLCLPLYNNLSFEEVDFVCRILLRVQNN